jgi:hypothetical protein
LERESKKHLEEITQIHDKYRPYMNKANELEMRIQTYQTDYDQAVEDQRKTRRELVKTKMQNDELKNLLQFNTQSSNGAGNNHHYNNGNGNNGKK